MALTEAQIKHAKSEARKQAIADVEAIVKRGGSDNIATKVTQDDVLNVKWFDTAPHQTLNGQKDMADFIEFVKNCPSGTVLKSSVQMVKEGKKYGVIDDPKMSKKVLGGGAGDTTGAGQVIPVAFETLILEEQLINEVVAPLCRVIPMAVSKFTRPRQTAIPTSVWSSNANATEVAASDPTFDQFSLTSKDLDGRTLIQKHTDSDTNGMLSQFAGRALGKSIARAIDSAILNTVANAITPAKATADHVAIADAATNVLAYSDITGAMGKLGLVAKKNATVIGTDLLTAILSDLKDSTGRPLWNATGRDGLADALPDRVLGRPYVETDQIATYTENSLDVTRMYFGNFNDYWIGARQGLEVTISDHEQFSKKQRVVLATRRLAGSPERGSSFYVLKDIAT